MYGSVVANLIKCYTLDKDNKKHKDLDQIEDVIYDKPEMMAFLVGDLCRKGMENDAKKLFDRNPLCHAYIKEEVLTKL